MEHPFEYIGCFLRPETLEEAMAGFPRVPLKRIIPHPHITFSYLPQEVDSSLFGARLKITALGYGNDGVNEGLLVRAETDEPALGEMFAEIQTPHITLSVAEGGKPYNTRFLTFREIAPFPLSGLFGGMTLWGDVILFPWTRYCL